MALLPASLYTAAQTRELDRQAIATGLSAYELMQRAAQGVLLLIKEKYPGTQSMLVVCGGGNNAGDGYVLARLAAEQEIAVDVLSLVPVEELKGEAQQAWDDLQASSPRLVGREALGREDQYDLLIDGMLGTGLSRPVEGDLADVIERFNRYPAKRIAIDIPSGLSSDTGLAAGAVVQANMTLSVVGLNQGLFTADGPEYAGEVYFNDLGLSDAVLEPVAAAGERVEANWVKQRLQPRSRTAHKGQCGHVLIVGGNLGMSGAALIAGQAALRTGAGLVSIATRPNHAAHLNITQPELMCHGIAEIHQLQQLIDQASVIALGPGLGQGVWAKELFQAAVNADKPLVVDADGLNLLAQDFVDREHWVLTPHPGEAARLTGTSTSAVQGDRFNTAQSLAEHYKATVVLKGAGTVIAQSATSYLLSDTGNPGMASGGMGDCLTGIIAALIAQGLPLDEAAACGAYLHGLAADRLAKASGERGMLATDLLEPLRKLVNP